MRTVNRLPQNSRSVHCLWRDPDAARGYSAAVSLHSHTMHSRESLDFIPRVMRGVPIADAALQRIEARHRRETGRPIPFERAFWRPPLHPHAAYDLECGQVRDQLGLEPLVSITDHDSLEACAELDAIGIAVPYSLEWTVPYHGTVFHIGVHILPAPRAREFEAAMNAATANPSRDSVASLLDAMHAIPGVLVILNHPLSCEARVPNPEHRRLLMQFLSENSQWFHAFELNGLQPACDNAEVIRLAAERDTPVISGGDRHCCEPAANLNLTRARTFAEFVDEIRIDRRSSVLFMPQNRDPIPARYIEFIWHAVRTYPEFQGRERWVDRVHFQRLSGEVITAASEWTDGGPAVVRAFVSAIGFLAQSKIRAMMGLAMGCDASLEPQVP